jgi:MFS transporter, PAT family, beta-lactamase induction signal transducer AmpG
MVSPISGRIPPAWLMGLCNLTLGFTTGIIFFVLPQLLAAEHVSELKIAAVTAVAMSPNFWAVVFSPILDVRFSRRWYATAFAAAAAISAAVAVLNLHHLVTLEFAAVLSVAAAALFGGALGGWLSNVADHKVKNTLSKWMNIALISGIGVASMLGGELVRGLPIVAAAVMIGAMIFLPVIIFLFIPAPGPDGRLAGESFAEFNREIWRLLRRRQVVVVLLLFLSPCSSFALTNLLGGLGADFNASARSVSLAGGLGAFFPGIIGCFFFPVFAKRLPLRFFYLANGIAGSMFTLSLIVLPHHPWTFGLAVFGEFLFQAVAFAVQIGIVFEAIGPNNPLAATIFSFLTAATNVPVTYMMAVDGRAYSIAGVASTLAADAVIGIGTCLLAGVLLAKFESRASRSRVHGAVLTPAAEPIKGDG